MGVDERGGLETQGEVETTNCFELLHGRSMCLARSITSITARPANSTEEHIIVASALCITSLG